MSFFLLVGVNGQPAATFPRKYQFLRVPDLTYIVSPTAIHAASSAMIYERSLTVILGSLSLYHRLLPSSPRTSALVSCFS